MQYADLREYLTSLEGKGLLKKVSAEVDPNLEVSAIMERLVKNNGPAAILTKVKGTRRQS